MNGCVTCIADMTTSCAAGRYEQLQRFEYWCYKHEVAHAQHRA